MPREPVPFPPAPGPAGTARTSTAPSGSSGVDPVADFARWLGAQVGRSPHTVRAYRGDVAALLAHARDRGVAPGEVTLDVARDWLATGHAAGWSSATLARRVAAVRAYARWADPAVAGAGP
ncbi:MAG: site-specific integrase, partial [Kineosporiaceae bacterium]